jgi:hypothetical protein
MSDAEVLLQRVVEEAASYGADMIEFERVPDGLEISYFVGHAAAAGCWMIESWMRPSSASSPKELGNVAPSRWTSVAGR